MQMKKGKFKEIKQFMIKKLIIKDSVEKEIVLSPRPGFKSQSSTGYWEVILKYLLPFLHYQARLN